MIRSIPDGDKQSSTAGHVVENSVNKGDPWHFRSVPFALVDLIALDGHRELFFFYKL